MKQGDLEADSESPHCDEMLLNVVVLQDLNSLLKYLLNYFSVCGCMCVCVRERKKEGEREGERERERAVVNHQVGQE